MLDHEIAQGCCSRPLAIFAILLPAAAMAGFTTEFVDITSRPMAIDS
jgi:hypothetical protein